LVCVGAVGAMLVGVDEAEVGLVCFLVGAGWILRVGHGCMSVYGWVLVMVLLVFICGSLGCVRVSVYGKSVTVVWSSSSGGGMGWWMMFRAVVMGSGVCACLVGLLAWSCRGMVYASVVAGFVMGVLCCRSALG